MPIGDFARMPRRVGGRGLVTLIAFRLHLNLSTSGSLYFLIVVLVSASGLLGSQRYVADPVNCLNYFFVSPVLTWRFPIRRNWVALPPSRQSP